MTFWFLVLVLSAQPQPTCADVSACHALATAARESKDYEAFHNWAWAAYRKGRSNDTALMLLVARAQSLSGRPGDALVMLERIAALGASTDAATSEDFERVRALPRWQDVAQKFSAVDPPAAKPATLPAKPDAPAAKADAPAAKPDAPPTKPDAPAAKPDAPAAKPDAPAAKPDPPAAKPDAPAAKPDAPAAKPDAPAAKPDAPAAKPDALPFTTLLTPSALVHDAVSKRFIIADRGARRIAVIDEHTGQVATLVGAQGALGDIGGIAIDPQRGDLWVVTATSDGTVLHRMQLISGRVLSTVPLATLKSAVTAMAFAPGTGLVLADGTGTLWRVTAAGRTEKLGSLEYVPRALAADPRGRLYVAGDAPRLARLAPGPPMRRIDMIDMPEAAPAGAPFVVSGNRLHFILPADGRFEIRSFRVR